MTDRIHSLVVVLEKDMRTDDLVPLSEAIKQLRGVLSVESNVSDINSHMAEERARNKIGQRLWRVLYPETGKDDANRS